MKNLFNFILEAAMPNKKLEELYSLSPSADRNRCPKNLRSSRHPREFMRGYFGDDEDSAIRNIKSMINNAGIDTSDMTFEYGMFRDSSKTYNSVKITSKTDINNSDYGFKLNRSGYLYIINTSLGSKIRKKSLTPDNLGLTKTKYSNKEDLIKDIISGLKAKGLEEYQKAIISLCDCITGGSKDLTIDEILNHTISYTTSVSVIGDLTKKDFDNLAVDFGEVLGPMMLMDKLKGDVILSYPTESNAKLFDYCINDDIWISAKKGKGAIPSSVDTMKAVQSLYEKGNIEATGAEKDFLENIVPIIADDERKESGSAIRRQTWRLAMAVADMGCSNVKMALDILKNYGLKITENGISESEIDKINSSGDLEKMLIEFYNALSYKPSKLYSLDVLVNEYETLDKKVKEGMILYPIKVSTTNYIDSTYNEYVTKYANMVMTGYQMYLDHKIVGNNVEISFCPKQMSKNKFRLKAQGSVGEPLLKSMGIEMVH